MVSIRLLLKYIRHFFTARNTNGFGVHSPFVYQFTQMVLCEKHYFYKFTEIENLRNQLKDDGKVLNITDFGTGKNRVSAVNDILNKSVNSKKFGQLLFRISHYFKSVNIIELGTSLGVTTSYLASSSTDINCITFEGSDELIEVAKQNVAKLGLNNIEFVKGDINFTLEERLKNIEHLDLVFIDANHQFQAVINYFELCLPKVHTNTVFVFDDIYWSEDMESAWKKIKEYAEVTTTIDLFQVGIVFFNKNLHKKHYKMRF